MNAFQSWRQQNLLMDVGGRVRRGVEDGEAKEAVDGVLWGAGGRGGQAWGASLVHCPQSHLLSCSPSCSLSFLLKYIFTCSFRGEEARELPYFTFVLKR